MNRADFSIHGGFPFTQATLGMIQEDYIRSFNGLASAIATAYGSPYVILSGCETVDGAVAPGMCSVNGELIYCAGGSGQRVRIAESGQFENTAAGEAFPAYITRVLVFDDGGNILWDNFSRVQDLFAVETEDIAVPAHPAGVHSSTNIRIQRCGRIRMLQCQIVLLVNAVSPFYVGGGGIGPWGATWLGEHNIPETGGMTLVAHSSMGQIVGCRMTTVASAPMSSEIIIYPPNGATLSGYTSIGISGTYFSCY